MVAVLLWAEPARIVRSQVLSLRERTHVVAARTFGARSPYLIRRHVLPAVTPLLIAQFVRVVSIAILFEVALTFVGLGDPVRRSWGRMIQFAWTRGAFLTDAWKWWIVPPGLCNRPRGVQLRLRRPRPRGTGGPAPRPGRRGVTRAQPPSCRPHSRRLITVRA